MKKILITIGLIPVLMFYVLHANSFGGEVKLMFPEMEEKKTISTDGESIHSYSAKQYRGKTLYSEKSLKNFVSELEQTGYRVDYIELWIEALAESEGITKLFISPTSTGGCKIYLQPNSKFIRQRIQALNE